jgi:hypothetical protein
MNGSQLEVALNGLYECLISIDVYQFFTIIAHEKKLEIENNSI